MFYIHGQPPASPWTQGACHHCRFLSRPWLMAQFGQLMPVRVPRFFALLRYVSCFSQNLNVCCKLAVASPKRSMCVARLAGPMCWRDMRLNHSCAWCHNQKWSIWSFSANPSMFQHFIASFCRYVCDLKIQQSILMLVPVNRRQTLLPSSVLWSRFCYMFLATSSSGRSCRSSTSLYWMRRCDHLRYDAWGDTSVPAESCTFGHVEYYARAWFIPLLLAFILFKRVHLAPASIEV